MSSLNSLRLLVCLLVLGSLLAVVPATGQGKRPAKPAKPASASTERAFVQGSPLDLEKLLVLISAKDPKSGKPLIDDATLVEAIRNRKLNFVATDDNVERLKQVGAKDDVIAAVREVAPEPPKPAEPPKPTLVPLTVNCAPDCSFRIDGGAPAETEGGTIRKQLTLGTHEIEASKPGYDVQKKSVDLTEEGNVIEFALKPDEATRVRFGAAALGKMLAAVGDETVDASARGSLTWIPTTGAPVEWSIATRFSPAMLSLAVTAGNNSFELECKGETCEPKQSGKFWGKRKDMKGADAARAEQDLRAFRRYYVTGIARVLRPQLAGGRLRSLADSEAPVNGSLALHVEGAEDVWNFVLDAAFLPQSASHFAKAVPQTIMKASYGDYAPAGSAKLPKRTTITPPDPKLGAIQVKFDSIEPGAAPR
jgi:hypothetical protein